LNNNRRDDEERKINSKASSYVAAKNKFFGLENE